MRELWWRDSHREAAGEAVGVPVRALSGSKGCGEEIDSGEASPHDRGAAAIGLLRFFAAFRMKGVAGSSPRNEAITPARFTPLKHTSSCGQLRLEFVRSHQERCELKRPTGSAEFIPAWTVGSPVL